MDCQKEILDLASRVSSILLELCELEVFLLSWPEPSQSASTGSSPGKYSSGRSRSCPCHCIGGHFLWIGYDVKKMKSCLCILETIKPLKMILDSAMASKMKNIDPKKTSLFYPEDGFHPKKLHGLSEEPNPFERMFTPHHVSHVRCHVSRVRCHLSGVTCHMSGVRCQVSGVTCQVIYFFLKK